MARQKAVRRNGEPMKRRSFLQTAGLAGAAFRAEGRATASATPHPMKITRVRFYRNPKSPAHFNQSFHIVTVETDQGITGIGEGGSKEAVEQCAAMIIGEDGSPVADDVPRLLLSRGTRETGCHGRDRPRLVGHQRQGARRSGARVAG